MGDRYYENHHTKSTTWKRPVGPAAPKAATSYRGGTGSAALMNSSFDSSISAGEAPLPPGMYSRVVDLLFGCVGCGYCFFGKQAGMDQ